MPEGLVQRCDMLYTARKTATIPITIRASREQMNHAARRSCCGVGCVMPKTSMKARVRNWKGFTDDLQTSVLMRGARGRMREGVSEAAANCTLYRRC